MKQTIEIEVPDGKEAVWKDGKVVFEDIKPQLPKTWEEFCKQNPVRETEYFLNNCCYLIIATEKGGRIRSEETDKNLLPSKQAAEAHLAYMQLHQLRDVWREGWVPDWTNELQSKYIIYNYKGELTTMCYSKASRFLSFQDEKRAKEFFECFSGLIKMAGDLI